MRLCNIEKTKYVHITNQKPMQNRKRYLEIGQHRIKAVDDFMYLGSLMDRDNDISKEIKRRIVVANRCYFGLAAQPKSRNISSGTKIRIYKMILRPILTYGSETWTLAKRDEALFGCFERKVLRKIYRARYENNIWKILYIHEIY